MLRKTVISTEFFYRRYSNLRNGDTFAALDCRTSEVNQKCSIS